MGCLFYGIAVLGACLVAFCGPVGMATLGIAVVVLGLCRLKQAIQSKAAVKALGSMLMVASAVHVSALYLAVLPTVTIYCVNWFWMISDDRKIVGDRAALVTLLMTLAIWVTTLPPTLKALDRRFLRRPAPMPAGRIPHTRALAYRVLFTAVPDAVTGSYVSELDEANYACALLTTHGILLVTPFVASRVTSLLFGALTFSAVMTDPSVVVGVPIIVGSLGLALLRRSAVAREPALGGLLSGGTISLVCAGVLLLIAAGQVRLTWDLLKNSNYCQTNEDATTLPDFVGSRFMGRGCSAGGPFFSSTLTWASVLDWLLISYVVVLVVATLTMLFSTFHAHERGREDGTGEKEWHR